MESRTIAFVTFTGLNGTGSWPAIAASMARALEVAGHRVIRIEPQGTDNPLFWKALQAIYRMAGVRFQSERQSTIIKNLGRSVNDQLRDQAPDLVLCSSSLPIPFLDVDRPIAFWTDATFNGMRGFYPEFSRMSKITIRNGMFFEDVALRKADLAIYASEWAARSAVEDHGADPSKVHVVPFGPNLSRIPTAEEVSTAINNRSGDVCRSIFIGYDWERKQGPLAVQVHQELLRLNIPSELLVIGCSPRIDVPGVKVIGMIEKGNSGQEENFRSLLSSSNYLLVPSKAECFGIVYAEASAFGVPSVALDVGGVGSAIRNGVNGLLFDMHTDARDIADRIAQLWTAGDDYVHLAESARREYELRLNWQTGIERMMALMEERQLIKQ